MKHADQKYGVLPYTHHLQDVERVLVEFGYTDLTLRTAAWLHDVVEDTPTKLKEIYEAFGDEVAELVNAVTNEPGPSRKVRAALTYPKIRASDNATRLKLADRIANVRSGGRLVEMYRKEHDDFHRMIYRPDVADNMWAELNNLLRT
jgi:(p)ppGpp synthase/HD superfamily hydrolase